MDLSGVFDALGDSAAELINAKAQVEIAKINAQALRPPAPYPAPVPAGTLTTSQKAAELARSPALWITVGAVVMVLVVLVARR